MKKEVRYLYTHVILALAFTGSGCIVDQPLHQENPPELVRQGHRGEVVVVEQIGVRSREEIASRLAEEQVPGVPLYGVSLYRITYRTVDHAGVETIASGAVAFPEDMHEPAPLLSFQHGTVVARHRVPSMQGFDLVNMGLGSSGYVTVMPDYLGLGISEGLHPYVHAKSLAINVVDMIRAAQSLSEQEGVALNDQLFLMGYSEGGYATMAAHREIEQLHPDEFTVTASAPMAGPYNLSVVMVEQILEEKPYPSPGYLPLTLLAYDMIYDVYDDLGDVVQSEYVPVIDSLFDGTNSLRHINTQLPNTPVDMLTPDFVDAFRNDATHPFRQALAENDVHDWRPEAPMRMYHCIDDDQVSFRNAEMALRSFQDQGADHVELAKLTFGDHNDCAPPALFLGKLWFDGFVQNTPEKVFQANAQILRAGAFD